jgi:ribosomal protein S18 acetylase RimI-like enzyme
LESSLVTPNPIELNRLYIDPKLQGSGLAPLLVGYAEQECRKLGKGGIWLGVWEDNARGIRFYEKMGFIRRGEHSFWVGESKRRDWIMEKAL